MDYLRQAGQVVRCHTHPVIKPQTVAHHSWNAAMIAHRLFPGDSQLILVLLLHDVPEYRTGDTPAQAKWEFPKLGEALAEAEDKIIETHSELLELRRAEADPELMARAKAIDILELMHYCLDERRMGNMFMDVVWDRCIKVIQPFCDRYPVVASELAALVHNYGRALEGRLV